MVNCFIRFFPSIFHFSIASLDGVLMVYYRGPLPRCPDQIRGWIYGQFLIHFWEGLISANKALQSRFPPQRLGESLCLVFGFVWLIYAMIIGYKTIDCAETYLVMYTTMVVGAVIIAVKTSRECKAQTSRQSQPLLSIPIIPSPVVFKDVKGVALNDTCSFCMEEFAGDDPVVQLRCKHVYHPRVIRAWLSTTHTEQSSSLHSVVRGCPLCRKPIDVR